MNEYWVKHDFKKFQPKWVGDYPRLFGPRNEGAIVAADTADEAIEKFALQHNLNPFYLLASPT